MTNEIIIKPRVIIHSTGAPFVEHYIDSKWLIESPVFSGSGKTEDELFHMVARSIVGNGLPYWEVDWEFMNTSYDTETRNAWVIDQDVLGEPSGYGENINV